MKFIADFHIHSHFSIATSKKLIPEYLHKWAQIKGINVVGTGDFTHPGWLSELKEKIEPAESGLFKLKKELLNLDEINVPDNVKNDVRFILTAEISSIYKKNDRVRKVHNLIFAPDFESVKKIQFELEKIGNIRSDGRPILGLDSKNLLDIILNVNENCFLIPAHIWTPWFSVLGSKSGFDTIDECFEELTEHIFAIETGLSSDPPMNWICSFLDKFSIISNSDAHSPENLGREANFFDTDLSYFSIRDAMKYKEKDEFLGTVEFFPQEGKYHFDGHRKCGIVFDPVESVKSNNLCPVCGKKLTLGVLHRVAELADRNSFKERKIRRRFNSLIPLKEILSEIYGVGKKSKRVQNGYHNLLNKLGSEFDILLNKSYDELTMENDLLAEGIIRMREGRVSIQEGFDGEYGIVKVFREDEKNELGKNNLFSFSCKNNNVFNKEDRLSKYLEIDIGEFRKLKSKISIEEDNLFNNKNNKTKISGLNNSQEKAVKYLKGPSLIIAGPGTGKTRTLIYKIAEILKSGVKPAHLLNLTFSNFAADEINDRVKKIIGESDENIKAYTFHSFGLMLIEKNLDIVGRKKGYQIISAKDKENILKNSLHIKQTDTKKIINEIKNIKEKIIPFEKIENQEIKKIYINYTNELIKYNLFDFDDLIYLPIYIFKKKSDTLADLKNQYQYINVDEYQDINYGQYRLLRMIADKKDSRITAIGDPNQAIYGFRGASTKYINEFINDYPKAKIFKLDTSYRCTDNIINASFNVIENKKLNYIKGINEDIKISIKEYDTEKSEAESVARQIEKMMGGLRFFSMDSDITKGYDEEKYMFDDFTVLCRFSKQFGYLTKAFHDHSIPYQLIGEEPFYLKPPFIDIINLIKYIINPENKYLEYLINNLKNFKEADKLKTEYSKKGFKKTVIKILQEIYNSELEDYENEALIFKNIINRYSHAPGEFLKFITSSKSIDSLNKKGESVKIMTMHSSKGLEFNSVFITGCCEKYIPFSLYDDYETDIDEEKRLLYVAMTRAKKNLFLSYPKKIFHFNKYYEVQKSPFINQIKNELYNFKKEKLEKKIKKDDQMDLF